MFPLSSIGVLAPGSAYASPFAQPTINTNGNFSVYMSRREEGGGVKKLKYLINYLGDSKHFSLFIFLEN